MRPAKPLVIKAPNLNEDVPNLLIFVQRLMCDYLLAALRRGWRFFTLVFIAFG